LLKEEVIQIEKNNSLSIYWAAGCGGCEIAMLNLHEKMLELAAKIDLVFCPCLLDTKKQDLLAMPDGSITVTLFNGAVRNKENEDMARLLRRKSRVFIAFGACSNEGGIAAMGNFSSNDDMLAAVYLDNSSLDNPTAVIPQSTTEVPEGTLRLPALLSKVQTAAQVVEVDYFIPGCPPEPHQIWQALQLFINGEELPPKGRVLGAGTSTVCQECQRQKEEKKVTRFYRSYEIIPHQEKCLMEQGIICMGMATRGGCGALCLDVNMPCTGCYGAPEGVMDQGAKMVAALGSILDINPGKEMTEQEFKQHIAQVLDAIPDYAGTFYKYGLANSILKGKR
jgi:F420-non-reducing hydrogenase small subunit